MSIPTNCPNCGAPVDLSAGHCAYCDTPYTFALRGVIRMDANGITFYEAQTVVALSQAGIMTPNEARRACGLPEMEEPPFLCIHTNAPPAGSVRVVKKSKIGG